MYQRVNGEEDKLFAPQSCRRVGEFDAEWEKKKARKLTAQPAEETEKMRCS
jgi:hypothetical protein